MVKYLVNRPEDASSHPALSGEHPIGIMSGDAPMHPKAATLSGHETLLGELDKMGLDYEPTQGKYGAPERSVIIHNPSLDQMRELGRKFGQESVVYAANNKPYLVYTNGPDVGKMRVHKDTPYTFYPKQPEDYFTAIPSANGHMGYFTYNFDWEPSGLRDMDNSLGKKEKRYSPQEVAQVLAKTIQERLDNYYNMLVGLRQQKLKKAGQLDDYEGGPGEQMEAYEGEEGTPYGSTTQWPEEEEDPETGMPAGHRTVKINPAAWAMTQNPGGFNNWYMDNKDGTGYSIADLSQYYPGAGFEAMYVPPHGDMEELGRWPSLEEAQQRAHYHSSFRSKPPASQQTVDLEPGTSGTVRGPERQLPEPTQKSEKCAKCSKNMGLCKCGSKCSTSKSQSTASNMKKNEGTMANLKKTDNAPGTYGGQSSKGSGAEKGPVVQPVKAGTLPKAAPSGTQHDLNVPAKGGQIQPEVTPKPNTGAKTYNPNIGKAEWRMAGNNESGSAHSKIMGHLKRCAVPMARSEEPTVKPVPAGTLPKAAPAGKQADENVPAKGGEIRSEVTPKKNTGAKTYNPNIGKASGSYGGFTSAGEHSASPERATHTGSSGTGARKAEGNYNKPGTYGGQSSKGTGEEKSAPVKAVPAGTLPKAAPAGTQRDLNVPAKGGKISPEVTPKPNTGAKTYNPNIGKGEAATNDRPGLVNKEVKGKTPSGDAKTYAGPQVVPTAKSDKVGTNTGYQVVPKGTKKAEAATNDRPGLVNKEVKGKAPTGAKAYAGEQVVPSVTKGEDATNERPGLVNPEVKPNPPTGASTYNPNIGPGLGKDELEAGSKCSCPGCGKPFGNPILFLLAQGGPCHNCKSGLGKQEFMIRHGKDGGEDRMEELGAVPSAKQPFKASYASQGKGYVKPEEINKGGGSGGDIGEHSVAGSGAPYDPVEPEVTPKKQTGAKSHVPQPAPSTKKAEGRMTKGTPGASAPPMSLSGIASPNMPGGGGGGSSAAPGAPTAGTSGMPTPKPPTSPMTAGAGAVKNEMQKFGTEPSRIQPKPRAVMKPQKPKVGAAPGVSAKVGGMGKAGIDGVGSVQPTNKSVKDPNPGEQSPGHSTGSTNEYSVAAKAEDWMKKRRIKKAGGPWGPAQAPLGEKQFAAPAGPSGLDVAQRHPKRQGATLAPPTSTGPLRGAPAMAPQGIQGAVPTARPGIWGPQGAPQVPGRTGMAQVSPPGIKVPIKGTR